jgi:hypothetical protein
VLQPSELHSLATVQVSQLLAHLVQVPLDGKYPVAQVVQVVASEQTLQLDPQAAQDPELTKYPVAQEEELHSTAELAVE